MRNIVLEVIASILQVLVDVGVLERRAKVQKPVSSSLSDKVDLRPICPICKTRCERVWVDTDVRGLKEEAVGAWLCKCKMTVGGKPNLYGQYSR